MKELTIEGFSLNPFEKIGKDAMLITAGDGEKVNAMSAAWGGLGVMWGRNVAFVVLRPSRYTKEFVDAGKYFSICMMGADAKKLIDYMGTVSGRDEDKIAKSGLTVCTDREAPYFAESEYVLILKKLYAQPMAEGFLTDPAEEVDERWYPEHDYHTLYIAEITAVLKA